MKRAYINKHTNLHEKTDMRVACPVALVRGVSYNLKTNYSRMKNKILTSIIILFVSLVPFSCTDTLEETVYSELSDTFLQTEDGMNTLVYSMYSSAHTVGLNFPRDFFVSSYMSGYAWGKGGTWETATSAPFQSFTWDANNGHFSAKWTELYLIIRNANLVLDKLGEVTFTDAYKKMITAEAKGIRGQAYAILYNYFGTTPIFTSTLTTELERPRATEAEMKSRIETDLTEAIADLPVVASQYGRLTKGAALGILSKYYLQTKQWQKCADATKRIIDLGKYELKANYSNAFGVANEGAANKEVIWAHPADPVNHAEMVEALNFPTDFPRPASASYYATRTYWYDSFLDSFESGDTRKNVFVTSYVSTSSGATVKGYGINQSLCNKYGSDASSIAANSGIDLPEIRYADILLSRAEALNELTGPTQESIDLINQIRTRAGITTLNLSSFNQTTLRSAILNERIHELFFEGKERDDLIRNGTFISGAVARGVKNAQNFHVLFPIPQSEIDASSQINENNPGY